MRPIRTGLRGLGAVAVAGMLALAAPHAAAAEDKGGGHDGGGHGKPKPKPTAVVEGVEAWGFNAFGQLGDGTSGPDNLRQTAVTAVIPDGVRSVDAGDLHSLALLNNGTIKAWGANNAGQLGDGTTTDQPVPGSVADLGGVKAIAGGSAFSLALLNDGTVKAWGTNTAGQLGLGTADLLPHPLPVTVPGLTQVKAIAAGGQFALALRADGSVLAWGANDLGQVGNGTVTATPQTSPAPVVGLTGVKITAIAAGINHSLALRANGAVKAWGGNEFGQLGNGTTSTAEATPVDVVGLTGVKVKALAGGGGSSLALTSGGTVKSWGINTNGQLGNGTNVSPQSTPGDVVNLRNVKTIGAGGGAPGVGGQGLAVSGSTVLSWGANDSGQLGNGTLTNSNVPVIVRTGLIAPKSVSGGRLHSLAA